MLRPCAKPAKRINQPGLYAQVRRGRLAQLEEHLVYTEGVGGSSPSPPTRILQKLPVFPCKQNEAVAIRMTTAFGSVVSPGGVYGISRT